MSTGVGYKKEYKMRVLIPGKKHITVAIPYEVIERQATINELTVKEFLEQFVAVCEYDNDAGIFYSFKKLEGATA